MADMPEYDNYEFSDDHQEPAAEVLIADLAAYLGVEWRLESYDDDDGDEVFDLYMANRPVLCGKERAILWQEVMALQSFFEEFEVRLRPKANTRISGAENARVIASGAPGSAG